LVTDLDGVDKRRLDDELAGSVAGELPFLAEICEELVAVTREVIGDLQVVSNQGRAARGLVLEAGVAVFVGTFDKPGGLPGMGVFRLGARNGRGLDSECEGRGKGKRGLS
jgi:hypothetical protein